MSGDKFFPQTLSELPFHYRPRSIFGDGFFSDGDCMHVTDPPPELFLCCMDGHLLHFVSSSPTNETSEDKIDFKNLYEMGAACSIRKCSEALGSVLERPAVSSMIGYTTLTYVPRDSLRRSVHLAQMWKAADIPEANVAGCEAPVQQRSNLDPLLDMTHKSNGKEVFTWS
ncbi:hypothetical protein F2Q69_00050914 [Brassica cretica]|uniref:Uncharacterized protein n=1 Tax=Brassica cretica TaxID=69181 RepID=A0A8S9PJA0_BRACR|nr:hypothetical protein F2Q69_00050914 [Brassica cretica]